MWQPNSNRISETRLAGGVAPLRYELALDNYIRTAWARREGDRARMIAPRTRFALCKARALFRERGLRFAAEVWARIEGTQRTSQLPEQKVQAFPAE